MPVLTWTQKHRSGLYQHPSLVTSPWGISRWVGEETLLQSSEVNKCELNSQLGEMGQEIAGHLQRLENLLDPCPLWQSQSILVALKS